MRLVEVGSIAVALASFGVPTLTAQVPVESEVRQIVTFSFLPGRAADAIDAYRDEAVPLYRGDEAMLSFRAFREVESPVPLDLIVVSAFRGMAGMDRSNAMLRDLAVQKGTSIGAIYGQIGALSSRHTDQFVQMVPELSFGDPSASPLTALVWYRVVPGQAGALDDALETTVVPWERASGVPSATGRFLISDGWDYLRWMGFDSLASYQEYWAGLASLPGYERITGVTAARRQVIVASVPELTVR